MSRAIARVLVVVLLTAASSSPALAESMSALGVTYVATVPATAAAGTLVGIPVTVQNTGDETWRVGGPAPVLLAYHWESAAGAILVWEGTRTSLGTDVPAGASRSVTAYVRTPIWAGAYQVRFHLVSEGFLWFPQMSAAYRVDVQAPYAVRFGNVPIFTYIFGATHTLDIPLTNSGTSAWPAGGSTPVRLSYHWHDSAGHLLVWDGVRTALPADVPSGGSTTITARVTAPELGGAVRLTFDLVREGVAWFQDLGGTPVQFGTTVEGARWSGRYDAPLSASSRAGETRTLAVAVSNTGNVTWNAAGPNPFLLSYHVFDSQARLIVWDGVRTALGTDLRPGESRTLMLTYVAPAPGSYSLNTDAVREGVAWLSSYGVPAAATRLIVDP
jgi:hypothetical protein